MTSQRKALIVANDEYEHEGLRNLLAPSADAEALAHVLGDQRIGAFDAQIVRNEYSYVIQAQIEELFSESHSDDLLLLHFSGHGLKSDSGELFFAASNTRPDRLRATAVEAEFVRRCMRDSRSRSVVLLLDCCYGGAFAQGVMVRATGDVNVLDSFPRDSQGSGRGRAVITASGAMEYAFEGNQLTADQHRQPSLFTAALVEGLATGEADRDEDGWVSLDELYDYLFDKVREQNPRQTPSRQVEMQGELYLARSHRRRIRISAAPVPADLRTAMTDPNMYTRLGAVSELRSRMASSDLPIAMGAREALAEIARTDVRFVADPAATCLGEAAVRPEPAELHFGFMEQGSMSPHRTIRLLGPPIARACVPRPSHGWIIVIQSGDNLDISVNTAYKGILRGTVDLKGPAGEAAIAVTIDLVSPVPQRVPARDQSAPRVGKSGIGPARQPTGQILSPPQTEGLRSGARFTSQGKEHRFGDVGAPVNPAANPTAALAVADSGAGPVLWALIPVLTLGVLLPFPFIYAAARLRNWKLWVLAVPYTWLWLILLITVIAQGSAGHLKPALIVSICLLAYAVLAAMHALRLRRRVFVVRSATPLAP